MGQGQAYFKTRLRKFDSNGALTLEQTRTKLYDDTQQPAEAESAFKSLPYQQQEDSTNTAVPTLPPHFIGWQQRPSVVNVVASGNDNDYVSIAANYGTQTLTLSPRSGQSGTPYQVKVLRNKNSFPSGADGFASFKVRVEAGFFELTVVGTGQVIPAGTVPPTSVTVTPVTPPSGNNPGGSLANAPDWMKGFRRSYDGNNLRYENTGGIGTLSFQTYPVVPFAINNPGGVLIENGRDYGFGTINGGGIWKREWTITHQPAEYTITAKKQGDPSQTYTFADNPIVGSSNVVLVQPATIGGGSTSQTYQRIFVLGNSITEYWLDGSQAYGYDATDQAHDWLHLFIAVYKLINPNVQVRTFSSFSASAVPDPPGDNNALPLGKADGPHWEQHYWQLGTDYDQYQLYWNPNFSRFQAIQDWKPDLILFRFGENVQDGSHDLKGHLIALNDFLKAQNSACNTVITESMWGNGFGYNTAAQQAASDKGWTLVSLDNITADPNDPRKDAGRQNHPNNLGMAYLETKVYAGVLASAGTTAGGGGGGDNGGDGSQGGGNTSLNNKPTFETFDYLVPQANYQTNWPDYDSRIRMNRAIGDKIVLQNSYIRAEIWKNYGCSVAHVSVPGGANLINQSNDLGRGVGLTYYRGGRTRQQEGTGKRLATNWASEEGGGVGNDPIQIGDTWEYPSQVLDMRRVGDNFVYTKTQIMNWAVENEVTDMIIEQWIYLHERAVHVYHRTTCNRTGDHFPYEARGNEYPCFYGAAEQRHLAVVDGNGNVYFKTDSPAQDTFTIGEPWSAVSLSPSLNSPALGLSREGYHTSNQYNHPGGEGEFGSGGSYTTADQKLQFDWNGVIFGHHCLIVGTVNQIRTYALAQQNRYNRVSWKFNARNGRGRFWYHNMYDQGYPTSNEGIYIKPQISGNTQINWPTLGLNPSDAQTIYVRYKADPGFANSGTFYFDKTGQDRQCIAHQSLNFSLTCDGAEHTVAIPVSTMYHDYYIEINHQQVHQVASWSNGGKNANMLLEFHNAGINTGCWIKWVNTVDADPEP